MTGPKGNNEFCFPETSMFPEEKPRGTLKVEGKQNSLSPEGPVIKCLLFTRRAKGKTKRDRKENKGMCFVIPPNSNLENNCEKMICLTLL